MSDKSNSLASLSSVIKKGIEVRLKDLHTSIPGIIESFNPVTQLASVQPVVKRVFRTEENNEELLSPLPLPILINVPVQFPRGGGFSLTFPVKKGDECLLVFCERSIDNWHKFGGVKEPTARRFHDLSDATAFVGISSVPNKIPNYDPDNTVIKKDNGNVYISLNDDNTLDIYSNDTVNITATSECNITSPTINLNGNVNISGLLTANANTVISGTVSNNGVNIGSTHIHSQSTDGGGDTEQNTGVPQ